MYKDYEDKTLKAYCHYPLILAKQDFEHSQKERYRIITTNWTIATNENLEIVDYNCVHKNVYEMTLGEFFHRWWEMEEVSEDVISVEKI